MKLQLRPVLSAFGILISGLWFLASSSALAADLPDGNAMLARIDANAVSSNKVVVAQMIVHGRRATRTVKSKSWIQGTARSFTEYLAPARDAGTKMLKLGDELWTYTPSTDRTIKISGHMLRQSVMGSDLSYEDMMEDPVLSKSYTAEVTGSDTVLDRPCWILTLTASKIDAAYHTRKLWVDKDRSVALKEERFAKSGTLLKTTEARQLKQLDGRWVITAAVFRDALKQGGGTEFLVDSLRFNATIPDYIFSKAALKK